MKENIKKKEKKEGNNNKKEQNWNIGICIKDIQKINLKRKRKRRM